MAFRFVALALSLWLASPALAQPGEDPSSDASEDGQTPQEVEPRSGELDPVSSEEARAATEAGDAAYRAGRFEDAAEYFRRAYDLTQDPTLLYNLATVFDRLRRNREALEAYEGFLARRPNTPDRAHIEGRIRILRDNLETTEETDPSAMDSSPQAGGDSEPRAGPGPSDGNARDAAETDSVTPDQRADSDPTGAWALVITGAVLAAGGGVFLGITAADIATVEGTTLVEWADIRDARDRIPVISTIGFASLAVGIALAATGVVWLIAIDQEAADGDRAEASNGARLGVGIGAHGVALRGAFE